MKSTGDCWKFTRTMPSPIPESSFGSRSFSGAENPSLTNERLVGQLKPSLMKMLQLWRRWFWRTEESRLQKSWHGLSFLVEPLKAFYMITRGCQRRVVTSDELWLGHYDPESEQQSSHWKYTDSLRPDAKGILLIDYMEHGATIMGKYYANLLQLLQDAIKKSRGKLPRKVLLVHDNAPVHRAKVSLTAIQECGFRLTTRPVAETLPPVTIFYSVI
ncbi:hypothetical protein M514_10659 [Trichuris suis]|uniref:Tc1-like transposase DDE domain-containing protein n=1 Tax=Trichuris suis TaxID=68888 RepID=A0A085MY05_9BILA|nr:hypothetical protein M514_10659 [Trichuris suis]